MIYFTSDQHFWHSNILKYCPNRPYATVEEMNEALVSNWNNLVRQEDEVISVGDFSLAIRPVEVYTPRLIGKKTIVAGNHDWIHPHHKKSNTPTKQAQLIGKYHEAGWETVVTTEMRLYIPTIGEVKICHIPYYGSEDHHTDDKYAKYRPIDDGTILLCGHVHQSWKTSRSSKGTLMINVGVDVWDMKPVSMDEIATLIKKETSS